MSIIGSVVTVKPVYLATAARKVFDLARVSAMVAGKLPADKAAAVLPSYISMDKAAAKTGMGGKMTEASFITGLLYSLAAFAQGQRVEKLAEGLPDFAAHAVRHGASLLRLGAGVNSEMLRHATLAGIESMLALPARPAAEKKAAAPAIDSTARRIPDEKAAAPEKAAGPDLAAALVAKAENEHGALWAAYGDNLAAGIKAGKEAAAAPDFVGLFAALAASHADQAAAMLPAMAAAAGLVVITAQQEAEQAAELAALRAELAALKAKPARTKKAA